MVVAKVWYCGGVSRNPLGAVATRLSLQMYSPPGNQPGQTLTTNPMYEQPEIRNWEVRTESDSINGICTLQHAIANVRRNIKKKRRNNNPRTITQNHTSRGRPPRLHHPGVTCLVGYASFFPNRLSSNAHSPG